MNAEIIVLRLVHILGAIFWLGSGLFSTFFLVPAIGRAGPAGGAVMGALQQGRMLKVMPLVALLTILSGSRLLYVVSDGFSPAYVDSATGLTFMWSGVAAIAAFVLGLAVARPAMVRAAKLGAAMANAPEEQRAAKDAEIERLRRMGTIVSHTAMLLLIGAAAGMAVARYLG